VKFLSDKTEIDILNDSTDSLSSNPITAVGCGIGGEFAYRIPELLTELHKENSNLVTKELITTAIDALQKETTTVDPLTGETHRGNYAWKIPELLTELHKENSGLVTTELIKTAIDALQKETTIVDDTGTTYRGNYAWKIPELNGLLDR
jgi:formate dehydrogenase assembly factor FdhD